MCKISLNFLKLSRTRISLTMHEISWKLIILVTNHVQNIFEIFKVTPKEKAYNDTIYPSIPSSFQHRFQIHSMVLFTMVNPFEHTIWKNVKKNFISVPLFNSSSLSPFLSSLYSPFFFFFVYSSYSHFASSFFYPFLLLLSFFISFISFSFFSSSYGMRNKQENEDAIVGHLWG